MDTAINTIVMLSRGISGVVVAGIGLMLILLALVRREPGMMVLAALFAIPATFVMGSWSGMGLALRLMPLLPLAGAFAISQDDTVFSWVLPLPVMGVLIFHLFKIISAGFTGV